MSRNENDAALAAPTAKGGTEVPAGLAQSHYELLRECQVEFRALGCKGLVETIEFQCQRHLSIGKPASPAPPAGAGGDSGDLAALSAAACAAVVAAADEANFYPTDEQLNRLWDAIDGIRKFAAPTPDLGAQGEPVARKPDADRLLKEALFACLETGSLSRGYSGVRVEGGRYARIKFWIEEPTAEAPATQGEPVAWAYEYEASDGWQRALWWKDPRKIDDGRRRVVRDVRPLGFIDAAPAAPRTGSAVSGEEIEDALERGICPRCNRDCIGSGGGTSPSDKTCDDWRCDGQPPTRADQVRCILALIAQAPRDGGETQGGWQPIETAPKELQPIMLALDRGRYGDISRAPVIAFWSEVRNDWRMWSADGSIGATPTHWRPLPTPPSGVETIRQNTSGGL